MERQPRCRLATASRRRRACRANRFRAKLRFLSRFEKKPEIGQVPEYSALSWSIYHTDVGIFGQGRSDARFEPAFPALFLARNMGIHTAPRTSTRVSYEHGAVSYETNINEYSRHPTGPRFCLARGNAAIAACQARGHLHVAVAYGAQSGRT
jgi:hypothetical protein